MSTFRFSLPAPEKHRENTSWHLLLHSPGLIRRLHGANADIWRLAPGAPLGIGTGLGPGLARRDHDMPIRRGGAG